MFIIFPAPPFLESSLEKWKRIDIATTHAIDNSGPYLFDVESQANEYTKLSLTRLVGVIQVKKLDGNGSLIDVDSSDDFSICNLFPNSCKVTRK